MKSWPSSVTTASTLRSAATTRTTPIKSPHSRRAVSSLPLRNFPAWSYGESFPEVRGEITIPQKEGLRNEAEGIAADWLVDPEDLSPHPGLPRFPEMRSVSLLKFLAGVDSE